MWKCAQRRRRLRTSGAMKDGAGVASQRPGRGGGRGRGRGRTEPGRHQRVKWRGNVFDWRVRFRQHLFRRLSQFRLVADVKSTCGFLRICSGIILVNWIEEHGETRRSLINGARRGHLTAFLSVLNKLLYRWGFLMFKVRRNERSGFSVRAAAFV